MTLIQFFYLFFNHLQKQNSEKVNEMDFRTVPSLDLMSLPRSGGLTEPGGGVLQTPQDFLGA